MNTLNMVDMRKRPPHKLDVMSTAVYGNQIPNLFREGKYYDKGNLTYTYDTTTTEISVWECNKPGVYGRPAEPSWSKWSISEIRDRLGEIEKILETQVDVYDIQNYQHSYDKSTIHGHEVDTWKSAVRYCAECVQPLP